MTKKTERFVNGYKMIYKPDHPDCVKTGSMKNYVYEHRLVAEEIMNRSLRPEEDVHHLDNNRANNLPRNLLVLEGTQHTKLHNWLSQHTITPKENTKAQRELQLNYCQCGKQIEADAKYCSNVCFSKHNIHSSNKIKLRIDTDIERKKLEKQVWLAPTSSLAIEYGVSDKAIEKCCKKLGIEKPPRGYWRKVEEGYLVTIVDF